MYPVSQCPFRYARISAQRFQVEPFGLAGLVSHRRSRKNLAVLHEHSPVVLQFLCFPTTEATKPKGTVRAPQAAIFPLMLRGAGYRSPTLTICRNGLLAKNAKRRHGFCSEIICFSNTLLPVADHVGLTTYTLHSCEVIGTWVS
jgi:hypothetical protein